MVLAALSQDSLKVAIRFLTRIPESNIPCCHTTPGWVSVAVYQYVHTSFLELRGKWNISCIKALTKLEVNQEEYYSDTQSISLLKKHELWCYYETNPSNFIYYITYLAPIHIWVCNDSCNKIMVDIQPNTWERIYKTSVISNSYFWGTH